MNPVCFVPNASVRGTFSSLVQGARSLLVVAGLSLLGNAALAQGSELQGSAVRGQMADVGSTGLGLAMGAAEANPLGLLTLGAKVLAYHRIQEAPAVEQPRMWSAYGAFGWGAAANNVCILAAMASGGALAPICPLVGLATGLKSFDNDKAEREHATFTALCLELSKSRPQLKCAYAPHGEAAVTRTASAH